MTGHNDKHQSRLNKALGSTNRSTTMNNMNIYQRFARTAIAFLALVVVLGMVAVPRAAFADGPRGAGSATPQTGNQAAPVPALDERTPQPVAPGEQGAADSSTE